MPPVALERVAVQPSRLSEAACSALRSALGAEGVVEQREQRILHAAGKGYLALVRLRAGAPEATPDAVLRPGDEDELRAALAACSEHRVAVVPFGGGPSV